MLAIVAEYLTMLWTMRLEQVESGYTQGYSRSCVPTVCEVFNTVQYLCLHQELSNNWFLSPVVGNNANSERGVKHDNEVEKQEMKPVLTVNRK